MKWTKLIVNVQEVAVEAVANLILEIGIEGIEIDDGILTDVDKAAMYVGYMDESIQPLDEHRVIAYLDETQDVAAVQSFVEKGLEGIRAFLDVGTGHIAVEVMPDEDYENKWKEYYHSFRVGNNLIVTPIWEEVDSVETDIVIKIDPGMAFGSGTHETTSLCIEALQGIDLIGKSVVDVGCGSGILGIAAAKLGSSDVIGIDIDENAVKIAVENVNSNNVGSVMSVLHGDLLEQIEGNKDVIVANILADVIILIASDVKSLLTDDGIFIASGIIHDKVDETKRSLLNAGFNEVEVITKGEWAMMKAC